MKRCILFLMFSISFFKLEAQDRIQIEVIKFISVEGETMLIYNNDIKIINEQSFEIVDSLKAQKLKELNIKEVYFVCRCCGNNEVYLQNILSSSIPFNNLYILVIGKNKIHFIKNSIIECSTPLLQKLRKSIE